MSKEVSGACPAGTVATHEPSPSGLGPSGECQLAGVPASELGRLCAATITPELFEPVIKKAADELYMTMMETVQDWLVLNVEQNVTSRIENAERHSAAAYKEFWAIDEALGGESWQGTRAERIATLEVNNNRYHALLYAVSMKYEGETRHETALRYIREREAESGAEAIAKATGAA